MSQKKRAPKKSRTSTKRKPPNRRAGRPWTKFFLVVLAALSLLAVSVYQTVFSSTDQPAKTLTVDAGDTYHKLFVKNNWSGKPLSVSWFAKAYLALTSPKPLQTGEYDLPAGASLAEAVQVLSQGAKRDQVVIRAIEGKNLKQLYWAIKSASGVKLELLAPPVEPYLWSDVTKDNQAVAKFLGIDGQMKNNHLEGLFATNTYHFPKGTSDKQILQRLYDDQQQALKQAWEGRAKDLPYQTPYDALIMASIVEKETGLANERALVASVFVNRLKKGMRLQTDPTIIYGLFDRYDGKIYRSNISEKTDYNTYQMDGLPPTPIAMPSVAALEATLHPEKSEVYYFVATGRGGHQFSKTLEEHNQAVAEYRAVMKEKVGRP